jgi:hypothetical protein
MLTLRCTKKLLARLKLKPVGEAPSSTTRLGDWYGNLLYFGRRQLVLFTAEKSRLSLLVEAKDAGGLPERLRAALSEVLSTLGVPPKLIHAELAQMQDVTFAPTANRVVLGTMTDFAFEASYLLGEQRLSLLQASIELCGTPCVKMEGVFPCDVARGLFGLGEWEGLNALHGFGAAKPRLSVVRNEQG